MPPLFCSQAVSRLCAPIPLQDLIIGAYIPPEYQELIMSRCRWEEGAQRWAVDHLEWAGNLVRWGRQGGACHAGRCCCGCQDEMARVGGWRDWRRRQVGVTRRCTSAAQSYEASPLERRARREASLSGSEASSGGSGPSSARSAGGSTSFGDADGTALGLPGGGDSDTGKGLGVLHGSSDRLSDVYFSYAGCSPGPSSPSKRPGSGLPGSPLAGGRPRTAALAARQSLQRPISALGRAWG